MGKRKVKCCATCLKTKTCTKSIRRSADPFSLDDIVCKDYEGAKRVKVRFTFEAILREETATELVNLHMKSLLKLSSKHYKQTDTIQFGIWKIIPRTPFKINVEIVKRKRSK